MNFWCVCFEHKGALHGWLKHILDDQDVLCQFKIVYRAIVTQWIIHQNVCRIACWKNIVTAIYLLRRRLSRTNSGVKWLFIIQHFKLLHQLEEFISLKTPLRLQRWIQLCRSNHNKKILWQPATRAKFRRSVSLRFLSHSNNLSNTFAWNTLRSTAPAVQK